MKIKKLYIQRLAEKCVKDLYHCKRVWSAWDIGTMSEKDFIPADDEENVVEEVASLIEEFIEENKPILNNNEKTGIKDIDGVEVKKGDYIQFLWVSPMGETTNELDDESPKKQVIFKYGCFGVETETNFIPLFNLMKIELGEYIPNMGNKNIYTEKCLFKIVN